MKRWRPARRTLNLAGLGLLIVGVIVGAGLWGAVRRASWIANELLRDWAAERIAEESGGVYQLRLSEVRFNLGLRRVSVDSIRLETLAPVNADRPEPLPDLSVMLTGCKISGIRFITLVRNGGLIAKSFGCLAGTLAIQMPRRARATSGAAGEPRAFLVFQRELRLPPYAPRVRIARVVFPRVAIDVRLPRTARGTVRLELGLLQWSMGDLAIDPTNRTAIARPLFSKTIDLVAYDFVAHPNRATAVHVGQLRTSLTDSTLEIRDAAFASSGGGAAGGAPQFRHSLVNLSAGHITAQGVDYGALIAGLGVHARRVDVDSFRIALTSDKRLPRRPDPKRYRTPQQWMADLEETLSIDSVLVRNSAVIYREHVAGRVQPGVITFARIEAVATNLSHFDGRRTTRDAMTLAARAYVQDTAPLDVRFIVPLDAPRFDMTYRGSLGAMPASAFNSFVTETGAMQIADGQVADVTFRVTVRNGVAVGTITPQYNGLAVSITRSGSEGILGGGGIVGGAARGIATLAAKWTLRADNPPRRAAAALVGPITHTFVPQETLIAFLWFSLRDGLFEVVKR